MVKQWEDKERERDLYPLPIISQTRDLLRIVGLLKFYQEATSIKGNFALLCQFIQCWDHKRKEFCIGGGKWFHPIEDDIHFITRISRRGDDLP